LHEEGQNELEELNGSDIKIKVINKNSFSLESSEKYKKWARNGIAIS